LTTTTTNSALRRSRRPQLQKVPGGTNRRHRLKTLLVFHPRRHVGCHTCFPGHPLHCLSPHL